ncbi:MAG: sigma-70 family RNA polymerase sigma factor [Clostridiales bacterium]|nr:sigma-70 family RNA polymerase sigma factor [Clostridiales bacterium]
MKFWYKIKLFFWKLFNKNKKHTKNLVCAIYGNKVLPQPLDTEEEMILLEEFKNGNEVASDKLVEHNLRLVVFIAKKFENTGIELEDLISIGVIGLIKAVRTYSLDKNIKLATYASRCIENEILMQLRKNSRRRTEVSLDEPLSSDGEGNELLLADIIAVDEDSVTKNVEAEAEKKELLQAISRLERREQTIMYMRFGLDGNEEKTQKEVADMMGISQSYISRIEKKILVKLRKNLEKTAEL